MARYKFVFWVEDADTKEIVGEKKQTYIEVSEDDMRKADERDAAALKRANEKIGECWANKVSFGRAKIMREHFKAAGLVIEKYLERTLSKRFGSDHVELMDAGAAARAKKTEEPAGT